MDKRKLVITVSSVEDYGMLRFQASVGEEVGDSIAWPFYYTFSYHINRFYRDLVSTAYVESLGIFNLQYRPLTVGQDDSEAMYRTLKKLNCGMQAISDKEGECNSWGQFVSRWARLLDARVLLDAKLFALPENFCSGWFLPDGDPGEAIDRRVDEYCKARSVGKYEPK